MLGLLSNEQYSKVIGGRHPEILGMPYDEAWPEVRTFPCLREGSRHLLETDFRTFAFDS